MAQCLHARIPECPDPLVQWSAIIMLILPVSEWRLGIRASGHCQGLARVLMPVASGHWIPGIKASGHCQACVAMPVAGPLLSSGCRLAYQ